jgi:hypothetical protein
VLGFLRAIYREIKSEARHYLRKAGYVAAALVIVGYWISLHDKISNQRGAAWDTLRAAITWIESDWNHTGNVGQIYAIQTLVRDCKWPWHGTFVEPIFDFLLFSDCVDLKSVQLERMELGGLQAAGADFSYADLACSNLTTANLRNASLVGTKFGGSQLVAADLRGAKLRGDHPADDAVFKLANVSYARFNATTEIKGEQLKCACLNAEDTNSSQPQNTDTPADIAAVLKTLRACPANACDVIEHWNCEKWSVDPPPASEPPK